MDTENIQFRFANKNDTPIILAFIKELAEYEKLAHEVIATEADFHQTLL